MAVLPVPPLHALVQRRIDGDDALLRLARLRFEQAGLAAEAYAGFPEELEGLLAFTPSADRPPTGTCLGRSTSCGRPTGRPSPHSPAASATG